MRYRTRLIILLLLVATQAFPVSTNQIFMSDLSFKGLSFLSSKQEIIRAMGKAYKLVESEHECGFLSSIEQGQKYYQMIYKDITFTGNDTQKYLIEKMEFKPGYHYSLAFKQYRIDSETTIEDLHLIFGKNQLRKLKPENDHSQYIMQTHPQSDDAYIFTFNKKGKLTRLEYWSPC